MNNSYIQGYLAALENIQGAVKNHKNVAIKSGKEGLYESELPVQYLNYIDSYIDQVRNNYKELIKGLNENKD